MSSARARVVGVFLLALISLGHSALLFRETAPITSGGIGKDPMTLSLARLEVLRKALPAHATVGYEADAENPLSDPDEVRRFYLAQYALAPVIVVAGVDRDLVVGNYRDPGRNCRLCRSAGFVLQDDFGDGLMVFRRATP
jgi:hypothetical protein